MRPLLSLVAIVKDEAANIRELLESARDVADHASILDTGSTDGTQGRVREFFGGRGFLGRQDKWNDRLYEDSIVPFAGFTDRSVIDYGATRNRVLDLESYRPDSAVFTLFLSGDETLHNGAELRAFLETQRDEGPGAYRIAIRKGTTKWLYPRILRTDAKWRYRYPIHEVPFSPEGTTDSGSAPGEIVYEPKDSARLFARMKSIDIPVLTYLADQPLVTHYDHLSRARALLHLAQTHENLALEYEKDEPGGAWVSHQMQAMAFYWRRADLEGDPDEKHFALFRYFDLAGKLGFLYSHAELVERLKLLAEMEPRRPEIRYLLAMHASQSDVRQGAFFAMEAVKVARAAKDAPLAYATDDRVEWLALQIAAECAKKLEKTEQAKVLASQGIAAGGPQEAFAEYLG